MYRTRLFVLPVIFALAVIAISGCENKRPTSAAADSTTVTISQPIVRNVTDYVDFTGRTDSPFAIEIRPRVTGYLVKNGFKEGGKVKKDQVLFQIDDCPYKAELDRAKGELERAKASLVKTQADLDIGLNVAKQQQGAISQQELNKRQGARDESAGQLSASKANVEKAQLNYDWCKITSPIDGRAGRFNLALGSLVTQDTTVLTTVVAEDPVYAYFDADEETMLHITRMLLRSSADSFKHKQFPVLMGLADETGYPHVGEVDFANNVVNSSTGTITVRGTFHNPANSAGLRLMRPGMFVRIRLPLGKAHSAVLVSEKAVGTDQGQKFVFVVNDKNQVEYRRIEVGPIQDDGLRVITRGLKAGEWIIVSGTQLVRAGMEVQTEKKPMPTAPAAGTPAPAKSPEKQAPAAQGGK